jgi:hypothetical protein
VQRGVTEEPVDRAVHLRVAERVGREPNAEAG